MLLVFGIITTSKCMFLRYRYIYISTISSLQPLNLVVCYFPVFPKLQIFFTRHVKWYWNILVKILLFFSLKCLIFQNSGNDFMVEILRLTIHLFCLRCFYSNSFWCVSGYHSYSCSILYTKYKCAKIQRLF